MSQNNNIIHSVNLKAVVLTVLVIPLFVNTHVFASDSNVTLTKDQINEAEKDGKGIMERCNTRIILFDSGKLCDAFSTYLQKKCEGVDYLSDYCGPLAVYYPKRIIQKDCISHPPLPSDIEGIAHCLDYIAFNASYPKVILKLKSVSKIPFEDSVNTVFTVFNTNLITNNLISISFDVSQGGSKIA